MTLIELSRVCEAPIKVLSAYNGKILCRRFNCEKHSSLCDREVRSFWTDAQASKGGFSNCVLLGIAVYVDGAPEWKKERKTQMEDE